MPYVRERKRMTERNEPIFAEDGQGVRPQACVAQKAARDPESLLIVVEGLNGPVIDEVMYPEGVETCKKCKRTKDTRLFFPKHESTPELYGLCYLCTPRRWRG